MEIFYVEQDNSLNYYLIKFNCLKVKIDFKNFTSSYHAVAARVLGLSYPDYLKYCTMCGGELKGKEGYVYPVFKDKYKAEKVCSEILKEWKKLGIKEK